MRDATSLSTVHSVKLKQKPVLSSFYTVLLPTEKWYELLAQSAGDKDQVSGFVSVSVAAACWDPLEWQGHPCSRAFPLCVLSASRSSWRKEQFFIQIHPRQLLFILGMDNGMVSRFIMTKTLLVFCISMALSSHFG